MRDYSTLTSKNKDYPVLFLFGGGSRGAYVQAKALADLYGEKTDGRKVLKNFKEVWATSAGCLVAAALAGGYTPGEVVTMLEDESFLKGIFAEKKFAPTKRQKASFYTVHKHYSMKLRDSVNSTLMNFVVAAVEITTGGFYDTDAKNEFLTNVMNHELDPKKYAIAKKVPSLSTNFERAENEKDKDLMHGNKSMKEITRNLGVDFSFTTQDRTTKGIDLITTIDYPDGKIKGDKVPLVGENVTILNNDRITMAEAASASANPRPLFNKPVKIPGNTKGKYHDCDDGGMTGHNAPSALGLASIFLRDVPKEKVRALFLGVGPLPINYSDLKPVKDVAKNPTKLLNIKTVKDMAIWAFSKMNLFANKPFDDFLGKGREQTVAAAANMLPHAEKQIVYIAPTSDDQNDPRHYIASTYSDQPLIDQMKGWLNEYTSGKSNIRNHCIPTKNGTIGTTSYVEALSSARKLLGIGAHNRLKQKASARNRASVKAQSPTWKKRDPHFKRGGLTPV